MSKSDGTPTEPVHGVTQRLAEWVDGLNHEHTLADEAAKFIANEREHHRDEFFDWLVEQAAETVVATAMRTRQSSQRSRARNSPSSSFAAQAKKFLAGDTEALGPFRIVHAVSAENVRKPVGQMRGEDHLFVADQYRDTGRRSMLLDAFHRAIAKRIGSKTTAEVFAEAEYARLQNWFITGRRKDAEGELGAA